MEFNVEAFCEYINARNTIYVKTNEQHLDAFKLLQSLGFDMGYRPERYCSFHYISFGNIDKDHIHTCTSTMHPNTEIVNYEDLPVRFPKERDFVCASPTDVLSLLQMA